jgi:hypothetical protein
VEEDERALGMRAGHAFLKAVDAVVVYQDHGVSEGMKVAIDIARSANVPVEYRELTPASDYNIDYALLAVVFSKDQTGLTGIRSAGIMADGTAVFDNAEDGCHPCKRRPALAPVRQRVTRCRRGRGQASP